MDVQGYRRQLQALESRLSNRAADERGNALALTPDSPGDVGDASVADEGESEDFAEAELDATVLQQVRDALRRIDDGTFGRCVVDGAPIEERRLEAVPWTPYCLKHQSALEAGDQPKPTL